MDKSYKLLETFLEGIKNESNKQVSDDAKQ